MILSPLNLARVCIGESLEFTCSITGTFLEWSFPLVGETQRPFTRGITADGAAKAQIYQLVDNFTTYKFKRTSDDHRPVSSRLLISAVSSSHNGTAITCSDVSSEHQQRQFQPSLSSFIARYKVCRVTPSVGGVRTDNISYVDSKLQFKTFS